MQPRLRAGRILLICAVIAGIAGCASEVRRRPAEFQALGARDTATVMRIDREERIEPSLGYARVIKASSQWIQVGRIAEGVVYRPLLGVFTVEGAHVHEAALVVGGGRLVGLYLTAERAFVPLDQPITLKFTLGES
jgi:hypothetical protein